ncbi:PREDICTED: HERV-H LTR-associating protein 2 [Pygoscelis adeliae]|uniref:HERV-H LTR-associating protein 2 n=1 Tax=Pygoscelis adeliae TaxID=9238 RepID=UPI0004F4EA9F|nr:PREDICTED: HERV-H LTR-associating protein 2 [Pygoscelis adeliae]
MAARIAKAIEHVEHPNCYLPTFLPHGSAGGVPRVAARQAVVVRFTEQETVTGLFSKDCILPCPFSPGDYEVIYWQKGDKIVHSYYDQSDQLERQDPDYRHRTHLFHENIPSGNASLKLSNLTVTDEGSYNCYVGTQQTKTEVEVMLHVRDQLSSVEGSSTAIPCEYSNNTTNNEGVSVVWTLNRNAVISVLASFNGTSHSYQPRVQINQNDFSLKLCDLTANDSGEYLCNISTPHYTKLTARTLQVACCGKGLNRWLLSVATNCPQN